MKHQQVYYQESSGFRFCVWDLTDIILVALYTALLYWAINLMREHYKSWSAGRAPALMWYLVCTIFLCACRSVGLFLVPYAGPAECSNRYKYYQWELDGSGRGRGSINFSILVLSTASSALFFSSYSYFAHSLSKVVDLLTSDRSQDPLAPIEPLFKYSALLKFLNFCVWSSIFILWFAKALRLREAVIADVMAQVSLAGAALMTCVLFGAHFFRAYSFLRRNDDNEAGRVTQLSNLLKLRRVLGVCRVCTVCFAVRAILQLSHATLGPFLEDVYFIVVEIFPTGYMLHAFGRSGESKAVGHDVLQGRSLPSEFQDLKDSLMKYVINPASFTFTATSNSLYGRTDSPSSSTEATAASLTGGELGYSSGGKVNKPDVGNTIRKSSLVKDMLGYGVGRSSANAAGSGSAGAAAGKRAVANSTEIAGESSRLLVLENFSEVPTDDGDLVLIEELYEL